MSKANDMLIEVLQENAHSPLKNYIIPGLTSWLLGKRTEKGIKRLFTMERHQQESITPHSHRFDFTCLVLRGSVTNRTWFTVSGGGDTYAMSELMYDGDAGKYLDPKVIECQEWDFIDHTYEVNDVYSMEANHIHSIKFSKGAVVLFNEGPSLYHSSYFLEPIVSSTGRIPTMITQPWMFHRPQHHIED